MTGQKNHASGSRAAFTVLELLLVFLVVGIVSAITLASFRVGGRQIRLELEAQKVSLDIRRAQTFASGTRRVGGSIPCGYGVVFDETTSSAFTLFAELDTRSGQECPGPFLFSNETERIENIPFVNDVELDGGPDGVSPGSTLTVFFLPPAPLTLLTGDVAEASVTLRLRTDPTVKKRIVIRKSGEIRVVTP